MKKGVGRGLVASSIAVLVGVTVALVLLVALSSSPAETLRSFFGRPFSNAYFLGNMASATGYLLIAAVAVILSFRAGLYNLGGDGQIYIGALVGTLVALALPNAPGVAGKLLVLLVAAGAGALLAGLAGVLKLLWDAPELITTYLLSAALVPAATYYITGPGRDESGNLLATPEIAEAYRMPEILPPSELNTSFLFALIIAGLAALFLFRSVGGYSVRMYGRNPAFARYAGIHTGRVVVGSLAASGALHGLAGGMMILGTYHAAISGFSLGLGWSAIAVALVARLHPIGAIGAAFLFSFLDAGAGLAMLDSDFTFELGAIIQAVILLFVTARIVIHRRSSRA